MKARALLLALLIPLAGCQSLLSTQAVPAGVSVGIAALPCDATVEWWDEDGDGKPDAFTHRTDPECMKKYRDQAPPVPPDRRAF